MFGLGRFRLFLHDRKMRHIHRTHREKHMESYPRIETILLEFRAAGGLKHDYQAYKLFSLLQLLLVHRPKRILEFGTGTSTAVFADYVRMHGEELVSIDESAEWLENSRRLAVIDPDDSRFTMLQSDKRVLSDESGPIAIGYDRKLDVGRFDLVLVDGPSLLVDGKRYKHAINPDIFEVVEQAPPRLILVDIRAATVEEMRKRLSKSYRCELSDIIRKTERPDYRYFTEFHLL